MVQNIFLILIEHGFLGVKYSKSYDWLHEKYREQVQSQYQQLQTSQVIGGGGTSPDKDDPIRFNQSQELDVEDDYFDKQSLHSLGVQT
jgi:hypothetical protein